MSNKLMWTFLLFAVASSLKPAAASLTAPGALTQNALTQAAAPDPKSIYLGLRDQALNMKREKIGLPAPVSPTQPWAVLMDWGLSSGTATIFAVSDGTASVYLSSGGGSIGGGQSHEFIRNAAKKMVSVAADFQSQMHATNIYPLPRTGEVIFYVRTDSGVFTASASEAELSSHRHPLSRLGDAAQEIVTQYRLLQRPN
jgi:hypothetical protein